MTKKRVRKDAGNFIDTAYDYYPNGGIWAVTDARDITVEYVYYDGNNVNDAKLKEIKFWTDWEQQTAGDTTIEYTYDSTDGYLTRVDQGSMNILWSYDDFGRLKRLTDVWDKQINIDEHDSSGRITEWRYPGYTSTDDQIVYHYDDLGRLDEITDEMPGSGDIKTYIDYDQDTGAMVKVTLPNGTVTTLDYDDLGRLTELVNAKSDGGAIINSFAYTYKNTGVHTGLGQVERITARRRVVQRAPCLDEASLRRVSRLGGDGRYDTFAYDAHERLATEHYKTPQAATLFRYDYTYDDDGNRLSKKYDGSDSKVVWFSDETDRTTIDTDFGPSNQLARMWTQGTNTTGTKHTVCGSFEEENIETIEVVSKTTGDTQVDSVTAQIRDGLSIARALGFVDGANTATKATATATDKADNTVSTTNTGIDLDTSIDLWYEYDAAGRRTKKCEEGSYQSGDPYTRYYWNDAGYLKQVDIDYGSGESPRYARAWMIWDPTGDLVKLEIRTGSSLGSLSPGSGGTLVFLKKWTLFLQAVVVERDEEAVPASESEYVAVAGKYLYQLDVSGDYWYYHYDGNGSVAAITDSDKAIKSLYEYDAFGLKLTNAGTVDNDFGFYGGAFLEKVDLMYLCGRRFYEPETGLRLSKTTSGGPGRAALALLASVTVACVAFATRRPRRVVVTISGVVLVVALGFIVVGGCPEGDVDPIGDVITKKIQALWGCGWDGWYKDEPKLWDIGFKPRVAWSTVRDARGRAKPCEPVGKVVYAIRPNSRNNQRKELYDAGLRGCEGDVLHGMYAKCRWVIKEDVFVHQFVCRRHPDRKEPPCNFWWNNGFVKKTVITKVWETEVAHLVTVDAKYSPPGRATLMTTCRREG